METKKILGVIPMLLLISVGSVSALTYLFVTQTTTVNVTEPFTVMMRVDDGSGWSEWNNLAPITKTMEAGDSLRLAYKATNSAESALRFGLDCETNDTALTFECVFSPSPPGSIDNAGNCSLNVVGNGASREIEVEATIDGGATPGSYAIECTPTRSNAII